MMALAIQLCISFAPLLLLFWIGLVAADATDWVNPEYVRSKAVNDPVTAQARKHVLSQATSLAKAGPWTITNSTVSAPSKDPHDYLSWAPYHWPNCNWCATKSGRQHFVTNASSESENRETNSTSSNFTVDKRTFPQGLWGSIGHEIYERCIARELTEFSHSVVIRDIDVTGVNSDINLGDVGEATLVADNSGALPTSLTVLDSTSTRSPKVANPSGAEDIQKTTKHNPTPTHKADTHASCTPSPAGSMPPSATWTTCPYKAADGHVNPDVRTLHGADYAVLMAQAAVDNAVAFALSGQTQYSLDAANILSTFFIQKSTMMNPKLDYGQVVRGPGTQNGAYTGIVDHRGMVKVANAVLLLRSSASPHWSSALDSQMISWSESYAYWLQTSNNGKRARSAPNNHGTFYFAQLAAIQILSGDTKGAESTLQAYYNGPFQNQITSTGEQPLEAVRTRPWHYRCFNIEAMIVLAKIGDHLGLNMWQKTTKYGGTLQAALDHVLSLDPKGENVKELVPHAAAIAAAFGDPSGKYSHFIQRVLASYYIQLFWLYDQSAAFQHAPTGQSSTSGRRDYVDGDGRGADTDNSTLVSSTLSNCPDVFQGAQVVELDQGIFATCDLLRPYYL